jgi:hypothetical protein
MLRTSLARFQYLAIVIVCFYASGVTAQATRTQEVPSLPGSGVANASVEAMPILSKSSGGSTAQFTWVTADNRGRYRISLSPGKYEIRAKDEADGYPDPNFLLSADPSANFPEISVEEADVSGIRVSLGAKGGVLEGDLRNEATQGTVPKGKVIIRDARTPEVFVEVFADTTGHFQFTVPHKPILISATAPGYAKTSFADGEELTFSEGERRSIIIELKHAE